MSEPKHREWIDRALIAALRGPLKPGDSELRWVLVGLLLTDLAAAGLVGGNVRGELGVLIGAWIGITVLGIALVFRFRRYSEGGLFWFLITLPVFLGWNWLTLYVLFWTGVTVPHPRLAWVVGEVVGSLPLLFTITVLTLKLRRPRQN